ncbi:MAG: magnesium-translocating P-type ATPase [Candidatus Bathyarchaeia archaeon]
MPEDVQSNSEIFTVKENVPLAQPPVTTEEVLTLPTDELLSRLGTSTKGLSSQEAEQNLNVYGTNELARKRKRSGIVSFLLHFKSPLILILLAASVFAAVSKDIPDFTIIVSIVLISVIIDHYQESKAENAAELLKEKVSTTATVLRDNTKTELKLSQIVPGDIIYLSAGDIVPADSRITNARDLFINQSTLTGESFPVEKTANTIESINLISGSITEWNNYLFMGTSVVSGSATAVVARTGGSTEYGKIAKKLVARPPETEFERGVKGFSYLIMQVTFVLVVFVFIVLALFHRGLLESLLFAAALAVGLTPELLPMIITMNLSKGAVNMSKKGVIVKHLPSIENFGSMNVLCTDKTGTLTENRISLVLHVDSEGNDDDKVFLYSYLNSYYETGLKSPLDDAILSHKEINIEGFQKIDEVPFDFVRRRVSVVVEREKERFFIAKGAPEEILKVSDYCEIGGIIQDISEEIRKKIEQKYFDLSSDGLRVLGVAYKKLREDKAVYSVNDENDMVFLGFVAFLDPPKETTKESLRLLAKEGIELKILTGDNELVTRKVCEQLGFEIKGVVLGSEMIQMHDDALARVVEEVNVFARVTPVQKDRIINLLKSNGHVVGFMGDGINDAPSLKTSDVGVSVNNAVDVAKESADIILLENDLTVLAEGVIEGRKTFGNTMKYVMMGISSNFGNMFSVAGAALFLPFLPMLSIQILLNNLLYTLSQTTIATDNVDEEYIERPKRWDISFIRNFMIVEGPISSIFDYATFFTMALVFGIPITALATGFPKATLFQRSQFQTAWFVESLLTQTLVVFVIRTRQSPFWKSKPGKYLVMSSLSVVAAAIIIPYTVVGRLFDFEPLPPLFYVALFLMIVSYLLLAETVKKWFYKRHAFRIEQALVPKRKAFYLSRNARLVQDIAAVVCLRQENEITFDSLLEDLSRSINYPIDSDQVHQNLEHLRRGGLIVLDWHRRVIKREASIKEYITKQVVASEMWPLIFEDWLRINRAIQDKYGKANPDFQNLLTPKQY